MHPVIRISIFLIFTYFIVQAKPGQLMLAGFILFSISFFQSSKITKLMWNMIWRLKWFYLSIFILFSFFTSSDHNRVSVTSIDSLVNFNSVFYFALIKIIALMLIVISVIVLIVSIPREDLISSLIFLSKPLSIFGFSSERFAVRIYLIIEFVEILPDLISNKPESNNGKSSSKIKWIVSSMNLVTKDVYQLAENTHCKKILYDKMKLPEFYQWGYLLISIGLFYFSDIVFTKMVN